jgi:triacylglycerol lipase
VNTEEIKQPKNVKDPGEIPLQLKSRLRGPISELSTLRKSLLFAELSMIAYNDDHEVREAVGAVGFDTIKFFDNDGSQAYKIENQYDVVITCRGTEPNEWNDIKADANAIAAVAETVGKVHSGFKREVDDLWPIIKAELTGEKKPIYFTGHSLGGAMATICAGRCFKAEMEATPAELYTYGSPRVGDKRYVTYAPIDHKRWVNNNDIVTRVPPRWMGYTHCGVEYYIDNHGNLRDVKGWNRFKDRLRGFMRGLTKLTIDHFSDHSTHEYITHIVTAICKEEGITREQLYADAPTEKDVHAVPVEN